MVTSRIQIANNALAKLGQDSIIAIDTETLWGSRIANNYENNLLAVLSVAEWNEFTKVINISPVQQVAGTYSYEYLLPSNFVRVNRVVASNNGSNDSIDSTIIGNKLYCNANDISLFYVDSDDTSVTILPALTEAIASRLALTLAPFVDASPQFIAVKQLEYRQALDLAIKYSSDASIPIVIGDTEWVDSRFRY